MSAISRAMIQKSLIGISAATCLLLGQNCGRQMEFNGGSGFQPSMKDGSPLVTTLPAGVNEAPPSNEAAGSPSFQASGPNSAAPESQPGDEPCMDIHRVEHDDLKRVAGLDDHGNVKDIVICHNEQHPRDKLVNEHDLKAHLGHGDYIGACGQPAVRSCRDKVSSHDSHDDGQEHGNCKDHKS